MRDRIAHWLVNFVLNHIGTKKYRERLDTLINLGIYQESQEKKARDKDEAIIRKYMHVPPEGTVYIQVCWLCGASDGGPHRKRCSVVRHGAEEKYILQQKNLAPPVTGKPTINIPDGIPDIDV